MLSDHITSTPYASHEVERWLPVPEWTDFDISDVGRIRSYLLRGDHDWCRRQQAAGLVPNILRPSVMRSGHLRVRLTRWADGKPERRMFGVHNLVLMAFVGPCPPGMEACHFPDSDPANNRLSNLRWDTRSENMKDVVRHGNHPNAVLSETDIRDIWTKLVEGKETIKTIASQFGVTRQAINGIKSRRSWSHVTRDLPGEPLFYQHLLDQQERDEVKRLRADGLKIMDIASECGISRLTVRRVLRGS